MTDPRIIELYKAMPGAPVPSKEDGYFMWGDVEGNEHWAFCEIIIHMIDVSIYRASRSAVDQANDLIIAQMQRGR